MLDTLDSYIYTGVSFSTFSFDEVSLLCLKYILSKFRKKKYFSLIKEQLNNNPYIFDYDDNSINYFIHNILISLENASLIISPTKEEIKLSTKYLKRDINYSSSFKIIDLSNESKLKKACFVLKERKDAKRLNYLITDFNNYNIIYLEDIIKETKENVNSETLIDEIKLKILQDNDSELFFVFIDIFTNIISDFIYNLNKISINL